MSDTSGPAFPEAFYPTPQSDAPDYRRGMTLRDYFAAQALAGLLSDESSIRAMQAQANRDHVALSQIVATNAYDAADAMLEKRASAQHEGHGETETGT